MVTWKQNAMVRNSMAVIGAITVAVSCSMGSAKKVRGLHKDGWVLKFSCPTTVRKGETCKMVVALQFGGKKGFNKVAEGATATVVLTIADKDTFSRDDIILSKTFTFDEGEYVKCGGNFCGNLKKDLGKKSEIYAKMKITASLKGVGRIPLLGYKAIVKTPTVKVKTVK